MEEKGGDDIESSEWVLDSLVGYLRSPVWQEPLMKFLEDKSVGKHITCKVLIRKGINLNQSKTVFGPEDEEEWQIEFERVFEEYTNLIDGLLEVHMNEMDISPEQFEEACQLAEGILSAKLHQNLFEQIWAASDFDTFKRMMIQLNIDFQLHALEVLAAKYGMVPDSFLFDGVSKEQFEQEDTLFKEAVRRSLAEVEAPPPLQNVVEVHQDPDDRKESKSEGNDCGSVASMEPITSIEREKSARSFIRKVRAKPAGGSPPVEEDDDISVDDIKSRQEYLRSALLPVHIYLIQLNTFFQIEIRETNYWRSRKKRGGSNLNGCGKMPKRGRLQVDPVLDL